MNHFATRKKHTAKVASFEGNSTFSSVQYNQLFGTNKSSESQTVVTALKTMPDNSVKLEEISFFVSMK